MQKIFGASHRINAYNITYSPLVQTRTNSLRIYFSYQKYGIPMTTIWLAIGLENPLGSRPIASHMTDGRIAERGAD
uniref:Uncharacterized protein n=1 Tax=Romanomermis culicivorax TaxID=13658 RepID=A0A915HR56_ROMCU